MTNNIFDAPAHMGLLKSDADGHLIPYAIAVVEGQPDYTKINPLKMQGCLKRGACWLCGEPLGANKAFLVKPIETVQRTTHEPACHRSCCEFAVRSMPKVFLPDRVIALWVSEQIGTYASPTGEIAIGLGVPKSVEWFKGGVAASHEEVVGAIEADLPKLIEDSMRESQAAIMAHVRDQLARLQKFFPPSLEELAAPTAEELVSTEAPQPAAEPAA